ncbi:MAG: glycosyltransferase, partial [Planctomycetes bacterium]|nr:glycosyltransferase [Planctomycetota bacterium]
MINNLKLRFYRWLAIRAIRKRFQGAMPVTKAIPVVHPQCQVLWNGVDVDELEAAAKEPIDLSMVADAPWFLFVGRFEQEKGVSDLLHAFRDISPSAHLLLLGSGPLEAMLKDLSSKLDLANRVHFIGHCDNPMPYMAAANALVLPSYLEALPLVLLETMALQTPVIATPVGGV